uniref:Uncharacterized protein n=1 Tax=Meloidogyne enterolobii TaxID=390850 RepID=A0A6V7WVD6_MELEN|nr:unnamed protein product [Meloidogyne enterolobii]
MLKIFFIFNIKNFLLINFLIFGFNKFFVKGNDNSDYRVHYFKAPDGKWLSLLNVQVVLENPMERKAHFEDEDVVDVEPIPRIKSKNYSNINLNKNEDEDFFEDYDDDDDWTIVTVQLKKKKGRKKGKPKKIIEELRDTNKEKMEEEGKIEDVFGRKLSEIEEKEVKKEEKIKATEGKETKKYIEEKVEKKFVKKGKMKDEKYKEKIKNIPELPLLKSILPWIPHTLRKHKQSLLYFEKILKYKFNIYSSKS